MKIVLMAQDLQHQIISTVTTTTNNTEKFIGTYRYYSTGDLGS
jgi:hypothetical protein